MNARARGDVRSKVLECRGDGLSEDSCVEGEVTFPSSAVGVFGSHRVAVDPQVFGDQLPDLAWPEQ